MKFNGHTFIKCLLHARHQPCLRGLPVKSFHDKLSWAWDGPSCSACCLLNESLELHLEFGRRRFSLRKTYPWILRFPKWEVRLPHFSFLNHLVIWICRDDGAGPCLMLDTSSLTRSSHNGSCKKQHHKLLGLPGNSPSNPSLPLILFPTHKAPWLQNSFPAGLAASASVCIP